jgi:hypothetical protein
LTTIPALALQPNVDVEQASRHLEVLHGGAPGFGSLILLGNGKQERHCFFSNSDLYDDHTKLDDSREMLQDVVDARWNVYTSLATFASIPERGRGTRADVLRVPGVWADLDVKPGTEGYYTNEYDLCEYMSFLPRPTLEVASGSGGRHLYWLTHERLEARAGQELLLAWLDFLRAEAGTHIIENVHDTTRILRLAGTVRWPKINDTTPMPHTVNIIREGPRYYIDELRTLAAPAHKQARVQREETRALRAEADERRRRNMAARGLHIENFERVVRTFNNVQDWEPLLIAAGWTLHSDQRETTGRCRYWTRPGKNMSDGKSASTDFTDSQGKTSRLMSVYTKEPTLSALWENADTHDGVGLCSKWKFATSYLDFTDTALYRTVCKTGQLP